MSRRNKVGNLTFAPYNYQPRRTYYGEDELLIYLSDYRHIKAQLEIKKAECKKLRAELKAEVARHASFYAKCLQGHQVYIETGLKVKDRDIIMVSGDSCQRECWLMSTEYIASLPFPFVPAGGRAASLELRLGRRY